eukprot:Gregarina_sp_Pseudo_9__2178@NODE_2526_length_968_cov_3_088267_g2320_i0_p4_GENE_NODE_2526_length_968_cov_3_088267_g2320_i0NODE_2526_length_968_cov_3_088267_g2320_i0_p4_ORF_typecomplete_len101_score14_41Aim19/PF10315_9/0_02N36/PF11438_8/3_6N36/PF11438_8/5_9e02_NODE_2526_length_968_cov_3_088267_g2320_i0342644
MGQARRRLRREKKGYGCTTGESGAGSPSTRSVVCAVGLRRVPAKMALVGFSPVNGLCTHCSTSDSLAAGSTTSTACCGLYSAPRSTSSPNSACARHRDAQ